MGGSGRSHQGKVLVVGAVEVVDSGAGPGRIRLSHVPDYSASSLHAFLAANLAPGATAKTMDGPVIPAPQASSMIPMSSVRWPPLSSCPGPSHLLQPQGLGLGRLPRPAPQTPSVQSRRDRKS